MTSPIHFDRSNPSVIILCDLCPHWRALRLSLAAARECAANHEHDHHPDLPRTHQKARYERAAARRRAEAAPVMAAEPGQAARG